MNILGENLLNSMEILAQNFMQQNKNTQMIECTVVKRANEEDIESNEYRVKYLDNTITVFSNNRDIKYQQGDKVYVLVPDGDFDKEKIIISSSTPSTISYDKTETDTFLPVSENLFNKIEPIRMFTFFNYIEGCPKYMEYEDETNKEDKKVSQSSIKELNVFGQENEHNFNNVFQSYLKNYNTFRFSVKIKTEITPSQRVKGNYGLILTLPIKYKTGNNTYIETEKKYVLDINNISGNPYKLSELTIQNLFVSFIEGEIYDDTRKPTLTAFIKDFDQDDETYTADPVTGITNVENPHYDILMEDFVFEVYATLPEIGREGYVLHLQASEGNFFFGKKGTKDEEDEMPIKTLTPALKYNGKPVTLSEKKKEQYECYWFVEDASIKADSELYSSFGGIGWRCLNKHTEESFKSNGTEIFSYVTNDYQYVIQRTDVLSSIRYKCAMAIIQEIENVKQYAATAESIITIGELVDPFEVKLQTTKEDNSTIYQEYGEQVILVCSIDENYAKKVKKGQISFTWSRYDNFGRYIDNNFYEDIEMTDTQMKISFISEKIVGGINTISCTVYDNYKDRHNIEINQILGTATIAVSTSNMTANMILQNSTVMYKYDGDGDSPISPKFDGQLGSRMIIKPVQLSIYHQDTGKELTEEEYKNCKVVWKAPGMHRSMIQPLMGEDDETLKNKVNTDTDIQPINEDDDGEKTEIKIKENSFTVNEVRDYHTFTLTGVKKEEYYFYYTIDNIYNYEKSDNTITAEVIYNGKPTPLSTDFVFTKEGDNGTNNSTYTAVITHNGNAYGEVIKQGDNRVEQKLQLVYIQGEYEQVQEPDKNGNLVDKKTYVYKYKLDKKGNPIYKKGKPVYEKDKDGKPIIYGEAVPVKKVKPFENKAHWCYHNLETNKISLMAWMEKEYPEDEAYSIIKLAEDLPVLDIRIYNKGQEVSNNEDLNIEVEWSVFDPLSTDSTILLKSLTEQTPEGEKDPFAAWKSENVKGTRCQVAPLNLKKIIPSWGDEILNPDKPEGQKRVNHVNIIQAKITIRDESKAITEQRKNNDSTLLNNFTEVYAYYPIDIAMTDTIDIIAKKNKVENDAESATETKSAAELMLDKDYLNNKEYNIPNIKGGFSFVTYNSDGKSPGYSSMNDFYCTDIHTGEEMGYNNYHWFSSENIYLSGVEITEATEDGEGEELVISEHHSRIKGTPFDTYNSSVVKNFVRAEIDNLTSLQDKLDDKIQEKAKIDSDINFIKEFEMSLVSKSAAGKYIGLFIDFLNKKNLPIGNSKSFLNYRNELCTLIENLKIRYKKIEKYIKEPSIKLTDKDFEDLLVSFIDGVYYEYDKDGNIIKETEVFYSVKDEFNIIKDYQIDTNIFNKFLIADDFVIPEQNSQKKNNQAKKDVDEYKKYLSTTIIEKKVVNGFNSKNMFDEKNDKYTLKESYAAFRELPKQFKPLTDSFEIFIKKLVQKYYNVDVLDFKVDVFGGEPQEIRPTKEEELTKFKKKLLATLKKIYTTKIENIKESDIVILKGRDITEIQEIYNENPKDFKKIANVEAFTEKYLQFQTNYINTYTIEGIIKIYYNDLWKPLNELNNNFIREKTDIKKKPYNYYQKTINSAYAIVKKFYNTESKKLTSKLSKPCKDAKDILKVKSNTVGAEIQQAQLLISAFAKEDNSVALVYIRPIIMMYNRYELTAISGWDGSRLYVDEANDAYLYAPQVGAGRKNGDGTFTGMVMGRKNTRLNREEAVGLFGYSSGRQSMFLDADTGAAYFGLNKEIQLIPGGTSTIAGWNIDNQKFEFVSPAGTVGLYTLNETTPKYKNKEVAFQAGDVENGSGSVITYDGHFYTTNGVIDGGTITDKTTLSENVTIKKVKNGTVENSIIDGTILNNVKKDIKHSEIKNTLVTGDIRTTNNVDSTGVALIPSKGLLHYKVSNDISAEDKVVFSDGQTSGRVDWCLGIDGLATFNNIHCNSLFAFGNLLPKVEDRLNVWQRYINPDNKDEILEEFYINKATIGEWDVNHGIIFKNYTFSTKEEDKDLIEKIIKLNSNNTETFYLKGDGELYCKNIKAGNGVTDSFMIGNKTVTITNGIITKIE